MLLYFSGFQNVNHRAHRPKLTEGKALENNGVFVINLWDWIAMLLYYFNCGHFSLAFCFSLSLIPVIFTIKMRRTNSNRNSPLVLYNTNPYQKESCTIFLFFSLVNSLSNFNCFDLYAAMYNLFDLQREKKILKENP